MNRRRAMKTVGAASGTLVLALTNQAVAVDTRAERHPTARKESDGSVTLRNKHLTLVLLPSDQGYSQLTVYPASRATQPESRAAAVGSLASVTAAGEKAGATTVLRATRADVSGRSVRLSGRTETPSGAWDLQAELTIGSEPWVEWRVTARPAAGAGVARVSALPLESDVLDDREALLPGVAFIGREPMLQQPPKSLNQPLMPDPLRITVPVVAIAQGETLVAHLWDPAGSSGPVSALLQAPALEQGKNRIEVFLKASTAGDYTLKGRLLVMPETSDPAAAVRHWTRAYGLPAAADVDGRGVRSAARGAFTRTLWRERQAGWVESNPPGSAAPEADAATILALWMDGAGTASGSQLSKALDSLRKDRPLPPQLAYRLGDVRAALDAMRASVDELIATQLPSGAWVAPSASESLDAVPPTAVGVVMSHAVPILGYGALSGDSAAVGAGIRALEYGGLGSLGSEKSRFRVPSGSRLGEIPLDVPDLHAAATAAEAYVLGYQLTGEDRYLDLARYWADLGLSFVYLWKDGDRGAMAYASVPTFSGADDSPARATQAVGLLFGRVLRYLDDVRPDPLYDRVSRGILGSAQLQLFRSGDNAGLLSSAWNIADNTPEGVALSPVPVLDLLSAIEGYDTLVSHIRTRVGPDRIYVASGATIEQHSTSSMRLRLRLRWIADQETVTTLTGVRSRPIRVEVNESTLRRLGIPLTQKYLPEAREEGATGWRWDAETGTVTLRLRHTGGGDWVEFRWPDPKDRERVDQPDAKGRPER